MTMFTRQLASGSTLTVDVNGIRVEKNEEVLRRAFLHEAFESRELSAKTAAKVADPHDYRTVGTIALRLADLAWLTEHAKIAMAEAKRADSAPVHADRRAVDAAFTKAERRCDYAGEYYALLHRAKEMLAAWQEKYPEAAKDERRQALIDQASHLREQATMARVYDADGWLDAAAREARSAEYRAKAASLVAEADAK